MRCRRRCCARGATSIASRAARRSSRGCTRSRRTSASTCSTGASGARGRWTSARRRRRTSPLTTLARRRPGSSRSPTRASCPTSADPAELAQERETLRLAFVNALQHLPPKQRSVLILREVLRWSAGGDRGAARHERAVGEQRAAARAGVARRAGVQLADADAGLDADEQELLDRYVKAFEAYDMDALVSLLPEDATMSMPPYDLGCRARAHPRPGSSPRARLPRLEAGPHVGQRAARLRPVPPQRRRQRLPPVGARRPGDLRRQVVGINTFLDVERLFPLFGLPPVPPDDA